MSERGREHWRDLNPQTVRRTEETKRRTEVARCAWWWREHGLTVGVVLASAVLSGSVVDRMAWGAEHPRALSEIVDGDSAPDSEVTVKRPSPAVPPRARIRPATEAGTIPKVIAAMREQGATVVDLGDAEGLRGYLVAQPGGGTYAAYVTQTGAVVVGLLYAADGEVVTERQLSGAKAGGLLERVPVPAPQRLRASVGTDRGERIAPRAPDTKGRAALLLDETRAASGFWMGFQGPVIHVFADPTCPFSERHVRSLKRDAAAGRLQAHVIPVGILGERGALRAVEIAGAHDAARAWEGGAGVRVDRQVGAGRVAANNGLLEAWRVTGVPFSVWEGSQGVRVYYGAGEASAYAADVVGG